MQHYYQYFVEGETEAKMVQVLKTEFRCICAGKNGQIIERDQTVTARYIANRFKEGEPYVQRTMQVWHSTLMQAQ